jgi:hypothetical protein
MKNLTVILIAALPLLLCSCATPQPPQAYHVTDSNAFVIDSLDTHSCKILQPAATDVIKNSQVSDELHSIKERQTAVIILENYSEPEVGEEFRNRSLAWFMAMRCVGFEHIVFLQGKGVNDPEGLITLAKYD